jgi:hypothetical protein
MLVMVCTSSPELIIVVNAMASPTKEMVGDGDSDSENSLVEATG